MAEIDAAAGWRVPGGPVQYLAIFVIAAIQLAAFYSLTPGSGESVRVPPWMWGLLTALFIVPTARFGDRPIRTAIRGRSDAEGQAVRQSLRTGVLPPDASSDAYIEWVIQLIGYKSHLPWRARPWLPALLAVCSLVAAVVTGEPLWLVIAGACAAQAVILRWDLARMDACFASLQRQLAARLPA